ncbi:MAG TPA: GNAT family N-acetyltransferase [bacterium]|nr:GNAT family N-acetyltransferase [bacterium]HPQ65319.1 GNAT family N-acetyltransferase [bacterium]
MENRPVEIRPYAPGDRVPVRDLAVDTALRGEPGTAFLPDRELLADLLTGPFLDLEPGNVFVAVTPEGALAGYIFGSGNFKRLGRAFWPRFLPGIAVRALRRGLLADTGARRFLIGAARAGLGGEFGCPADLAPYPGVLHINLSRERRGRGLGSRLLRRFLGHLAAAGTPGVHCGTMSESARDFFLRNGFLQLCRKRRPFFDAYAGREVTYFVLAKPLDGAAARAGDV